MSQDQNVHPVTVAARTQVDHTPTTAETELARHNAYQAASLRRLAVIRDRAMALGGNRIALVALQARWAALIPEQWERYDGPLWPGSHNPSGQMGGGGRYDPRVTGGATRFPTGLGSPPEDEDHISGGARA